MLVFAVAPITCVPKPAKEAVSQSKGHIQSKCNDGMRFVVKFRIEFERRAVKTNFARAVSGQED